MKKNKSSGFTLIELMLSSLIILIAVAASGALYIAQTKMQKKYSRTLDLATVTDQMVSEVLASPAEYPMVVNHTTPSEYMVYVKCLNDNSLEVGAQAPAPGDTGLGYRLMSLNNFEGADFKKKALNNYCPVGVEVHLRYQSMYNVCVTTLQLSQKQNQADPKVTEVTKSVFKPSLLNTQLSMPLGSVIDVSSLSLACQ